MVNYYTQRKIEGKWQNVSEPTTDKETVYKSLMSDLIAKKLEACTYITQIKRLQLYNGYIAITVNYTGDVRRIYTVESH